MASQTTTPPSDYPDSIQKIESLFNPEPDSTIYVPRPLDKRSDPLERVFAERANAKAPTSSTNIAYSFRLGQEANSRRCIACSSFRREYWSITSRVVNVSASDKQKWLRIGDFESAYKPSKKYNLAKPAPFGFSIHEASRMLYEEIVRKSGGGTNKGLLVVTGSTNAAKSQITRGIIYHIMEDLCTSNEKEQKTPRKPHLVTFEDPIEEFFVSGKIVANESTPFDYTPRERKADVADLRQAFEDALRQTPSVFFVGETRKPEDWGALLEFAGSGHLVITTAHSGGLREAIGRVFGNRIGTPGHRAEVASRLLGVVHLSQQLCGGFQITFPSVYRRTPSGTQNLVADGLSSILPNYRHTITDLQPFGSLGRQACIDLLCEMKPSSDADENFDEKRFSSLRDLRDAKKERTTLLSEAFKMDLIGD